MIRTPLTMELFTVSKNQNHRSSDFYLNNKDLLTGEDIIEGIYNTIFNTSEFKTLGNNKMIIVTGKDLDYTFNLHPNVLITKNIYKANKHYQEIL